MSQLSTTPEQIANRAGLTYVSDEQPGIERKRWGRGFRYVYDSGRVVESQRQCNRIKSLVIPPAWEDVWICRDPRGHLQATGRDEAGRKQFLYHPKWQEAANRLKFENLNQLGNALPRIRRRVSNQLRKRKPGREKILALIVRLLDLTGMRIGNEQYVQENGAYGLTTLRRKHLELNGASAEFRFPGKSQQKQVVKITEKSTLRALKSCVAEKGKSLFAYRERKGTCAVESDEVNDFLREISGVDITAKDFRTWVASAGAAAELYDRRDEPDWKQREKNLVEVTQMVAARLGNTPAVCRSSYLDPRLLEAYQEGRFPKIFDGFRSRQRKWLRREDQIYLHALSRIGPG